jgi:tetratricopeptide (TPR) repeat protein
MGGTSGNSPSPVTREILRQAADILDRTKTIVLWTLTLGMLAAFTYTVVREVQEVRTVVDPIEVPVVLRQQGYTPEVLSTVLIDRVAQMTRAAVHRSERGTVAAGRGTADVVVPTLNISLNSTAGLFESLLGRPDIRVSGEVVQAQSAGANIYQLNLRVSGKDGGWQQVHTARGFAASRWAEGEPIEQLVEPMAQALLLAIDPLSAAAFLYVSLAEPAIKAEDLGSLFEHGPIIDAISRCIEECSAEDRSAAYVLWANLSAQAGDLRDDDALRKDALEQFTQAARNGALKGEDYTKWGDILIALGQENAGFARYDWAARRYPNDFIVPYNRGLALAELGRHEEAIAQFRRSTHLDGTREWTFSEWGDSLLELRRWSEAERQYRQAILLDGAIAEAYHGLSKALAAQEGGQLEAERMQARAALLGWKVTEASASLKQPPSPAAAPAG